MKVSIIIPNFNQARFLPRSIESVLHQDYDNLELFVYDNHSVDNSMKVAKPYEDKDSRVTVLQTPTHQPCAAWAINDALLNRATGDVGMWLNADDALLPGCIKTFMGYFEDEKVGFVRLGVKAYYEDDLTTAKDLTPPNWDLLGDIFNENKVFPESPFRMSLFKGVKGCDEDIRFYDWGFWAKCAIECHAGTYTYKTHEAPLILRRIHGIEGFSAVDEEHWGKLKQPGPGIRYSNMAAYFSGGMEAIRRKLLIRQV